MTWKTFGQAIALIMVLCAGIYAVLVIHETRQEAEFNAAMERVFPGITKPKPFPTFSQTEIDLHIQACKKQGYKGGPLGC